MNPALPEVRRYEISLMKEVVNQVRAARALGKDGAVLFSSSSLNPIILKALPETGAP